METHPVVRKKGIGGLSHNQSKRDKQAHSDENCIRLNRRKGRNLPLNSILEQPS
jgi:hypothetical protein